MERIARSIASWVARHGGRTEDIPTYAYAAECILTIVVVTTVVIIFGAMIGSAADAVVWWLFFLPLRNTLGGAHARTRTGCFLLSCTVPIACLILCKTVNVPWLTVPTAASAYVGAFVHSPVLSANHPLAPEALRRTCTIGRALAVIESAVVLILPLLHCELYEAATLGMLAASVSLFLGVRTEREDSARSTS